MVHSAPKAMPFLFRAVGWVLGLCIVAAIAGGVLLGLWDMAGHEYLRFVVLYVVVSIAVAITIGGWLHRETVHRIYVPMWVMQRPRFAIPYLGFRIWLQRWKPFVIIALLVVGAMVIKFRHHII